jgi:hypothetical protein
VSSDGQPFSFTLNAVEKEQITDYPINGREGAQSLLRRLQEKIEASDVLEFDNWELGQLIRYMTTHGEGGYETRLRKAFGRSLLDLFGPIFATEMKV